MTVKKAIEKYEDLVDEAIECKLAHKIDKVERKIHILREFIEFERGISINGMDNYKKERKNIKNLTYKIVETGNESEIDKFERQIYILRDFIEFEHDVKDW